MYNVCFVLPDGNKGITMYGGAPAVFMTQESAWEFVDKTMSMTDHPALMWVRKVVTPDADMAT